MQLDEYSQIPDITEDQVVTLSPGWARPQNKVCLGVWTAPQTKQFVFNFHGHACRGFTEDSGHSSLWTWKSSLANAASTCWPPSWKMAPAACELWRLPSRLYKESCSDCDALRPWRCCLWAWLTDCWLNAGSLKKHLTHPDESQLRSFHRRKDCFPCLFDLKGVQKY